ncbi:MAG: PilZ domain-containing protein [Sandaracinus sp.]
MAKRKSSGSDEKGTSPGAGASSSASASEADDQRGGERVTINKEFESFDAFIQEYVTNISRTGVFVKSKQPLPVGTKVNLKFTVIMDDIETIEGVGEVVRVQQDPPGMGVVFRELSQYSQHLIERLLTPPR